MPPDETLQQGRNRSWQLFMLTNIFTNNTMQIHTLLTYLNKENSNNNDIKEMMKETKQYKITVEGMNSDFKKIIGEYESLSNTQNIILQDVMKSILLLNNV